MQSSNNSGICLKRALHSHGHGELSKNVKLSLQAADTLHHIPCLHHTAALAAEHVSWQLIHANLGLNPEEPGMVPLSTFSDYCDED